MERLVKDSPARPGTSLCRTVVIIDTAPKVIDHQFLRRETLVRLLRRTTGSDCCGTVAGRFALEYLFRALVVYYKSLG